MVALRGTSTGSLLVAEGEGAVGGETKNERRNESVGKGKMLKETKFELLTKLPL